MRTFEDILMESSVPYKRAGQHHHAREGWIQIDCPFCGKGSGKFHMGYSLAGKYVNCYKCGSHSLADTIQAITGVSIGEAIRYAKNVNPFKSRRLAKRSSELKQPFTKELLPCHIKYLLERGFENPQELVFLWGIRGIGIESKNLKWRIYIPIHYRSEIVSWTTRSISDKASQRYISASSEQERISHKTLLYGEDKCSSCVVITEGPTDVWRIGPGAVATLGVSYSREQMAKMVKYPFRAVCFDSSKSAQKRARKLSRDLNSFPGKTINVELDAEDPGSASSEEISKLRKALDI